MKLGGWLDNNVKKLKWYDISFVKLSVLFATLFLVAAWTGFRNAVLSVSSYIYLIIAIVFAIPVLKKMFFD